MDKLRVLIADDHNIVRAGLCALVRAQEDMDVVAEAQDGTSACELAAEAHPDIAILDVSMPGLGGAGAAVRMREIRPECRIVALSVHEDRGYVQQLLQAGASGYVLKRAAADDLIHAIRMVARGGSYLDPRLSGRLLGDLVSGAGSTSGDALSPREEEVLRLIARGYTNREIAARFEVSIKTVETQKARAMEKLLLRSRADIVAHAIRSGWMSES